VGVFIGSGIGGFEIIEREHSNLLQGGPRKISPFFIPAAIVNMAAGSQHPLRRQGADLGHGHGLRHLANAIGDSVRMIMHGDADVMIAGGAEAAVTPLSVGGFAAMRALSTRNDEPTRASRPSTRTATASSSARAPASSFLRSWSSPRRAAQRFWPR
jgi:3-oxoacyl-[acyl-carrier-protein] synthase II